MTAADRPVRHRAAHSRLQVDHVLLRCLDALAIVSIRRNGMAGGATGWTASAMEGDTPEALAAVLSQILAGRPAEEVVYGAAGGGCGGPSSSDLAQATLLAASTELAWGLGEALSWRGDPESGSLPHMLAENPDVAKRVKSRLRAALADARDLLVRHRRELDVLAAVVAERETLTGEEAELVVAEARRPSIKAVGR